MEKFLKWVGIVLSVLTGMLVLGLIVIYFKTEGRLNRVYAMPKETVVVSTDDASIARGKHIFQYRGCEACHSAGGYADLPASGATHLNLPTQDIPHMEGNIYLDDPAIGQVIASNLTAGKGGVAGQYKTDLDWARAIRHGIRPDGTPLLFMPSTEFYYLSDEDLGAVIAYIKIAPPIDNELPKSSLSLTGRIVMTLVKEITFIPAELIPHNDARPAAPEIGVTPEYGMYLTYSCKVCHGLTMSGGVIPGFPSSWPPAPNLTFGDGSALPTWTEDEFINTIRTGKTPAGKELRPQYMPWNSYKFMSDDELKAVWIYFESLPKLEYGNR